MRKHSEATKQFFAWLRSFVTLRAVEDREATYRCEPARGFAINIVIASRYVPQGGYHFRRLALYVSYRDSVLPQPSQGMLRLLQQPGYRRPREG